MPYPEINYFGDILGTSVDISTDCAGVALSTDHPNTPWKRIQVFRSEIVSSSQDASGWRNPTVYRAFKRQSTPCPTDCYAQTIDRSNPLCFVTTDWNLGSAVDQSTCPWPAFPDYLVDGAISKSLDKLLDQKVNLATNLAEAKQVASLFTDASRLATDLLSSFSRHHRSDFVSMLGGRRASRNFLAHMYGVRPLMQDIHGAIDEIVGRDVSGDSFRFSVTASRKASFSTVFIKNGPYGARIPVTGSGYHKARVSLDYYMDKPALASLSSLGITNPLFLAWEEIPFSFVVDWFLPVGSYLNNLGADFGWKFKAGTLSKRVHGSCSVGPFYREPSVNPNIEPLSFDLGSYFDIADDYDRIVYGSSPLPSRPHFKNPISTVHFAEALALLRSKLR